MKIKKKMTENSLDDINAAFDTKHCVMIFKIKMNLIINIFMSEVSANFNLSVNHVFSLFHF